MGDGQRGPVAGHTGVDPTVFTADSGQRVHHQGFCDVADYTAFVPLSFPVLVVRLHIEYDRLNIIYHTGQISV